MILFAWITLLCSSTQRLSICKDYRDGQALGLWVNADECVKIQYLIVFAVSLNIFLSLHVFFRCWKHSIHFGSLIYAWNQPRYVWLNLFSGWPCLICESCPGRYREVILISLRVFVSWSSWHTGVARRLYRFHVADGLVALADMYFETPAVYIVPSKATMYSRTPDSYKCRNYIIVQVTGHQEMQPNSLELNRAWHQWKWRVNSEIRE